MKKRTFILGLVSMLFPITNALADEGYEMEIHIEYWPFENIEEMRSVSSDIVQLEILDERAEWINIWENHDGVVPSERDLYDVYTIHRARVLDVFQGDLTIGEIIEVRQIGGSLEGTVLRNPSMVNFSYGDNVVLFLGEAATSHFVIMLPYQAAFIINDDGKLFGYHQMQGFDDLGLTWDILEQIQYDNGIESIPINNESNDMESSDVESGSVENNDIESNGIVRIGTAIVGAVLAILLVILIMRNRKKRINS